MTDFTPRMTCRCEGYYVEDKKTVLLDDRGREHAFESCHLFGEAYDKPKDPDWAAELVRRLATGGQLLPWPEAPQDVALIALYIDRLRTEGKTLHKLLAEVVVTYGALLSSS